MYNLHRFAEKYQLALQAAIAEKPNNGLCGIEIEWNLLDSGLRPLLTIGTRPRKQSFVDYLRGECICPLARGFSQLEVFHWMIEWATRPYYHLQGAIYEGWLMEAVLLNAFHQAGRQFNERLYTWYGNLPL